MFYTIQKLIPPKIKLLLICLVGIELVSETTEEELKANEGQLPELTTGVTVAYTKPAQQTEVMF